MSTNNWMSDLNPDTKLIDLCIPASHDSSSYEQNGDNQGISPLKGNLSGSITQGYDYAQQLDAGIRYFDVRCVMAGGVVHLHHGIINGGLFETVLLDQILPFATANPSEVIFLDIDLKSEDAIQPVLEILKRNIPVHMIATEHLNSDGSFNTNCTFGNLKNNGRQFVITWSSRAYTAQADNQLYGDWGGVRDTPNMVRFGDSFYMCVLDHDGSIFIAQSSDGITWPDKNALEQQRLFGDWSNLQSTPTLAALGNTLFMCVLDQDGGIYMAQSNDGLTWPDKQSLQKSRLYGDWESPATATPTLVNAWGNLYMCVLDSDGGIYIAESTDGVTWPTKQTLSDNRLYGDWGGINRTPTMALFANTLYMCVLDHNRGIHLGSSTNGTTWSSKQQLTDNRLYGDWAGVPDTPNFMVFDEAIFMLVLNNNGNIFIAKSTDGSNWPSKSGLEYNKLFGNWGGLSTTPTLVTTAPNNPDQIAYMCRLNHNGNIFMSESKDGLTWFMPTDSSIDWLSFNESFRWSPYGGFNEKSVEQILDLLDGYVEEWNQNRNKMFIAQVIDTPRFSFVPGFSPSSLEKQYGQQLNDWVEKQQNQGKLNIVFRDFVDRYPYLVTFLINQNKVLVS